MYEVMFNWRLVSSKYYQVGYCYELHTEWSCSNISLRLPYQWNIDWGGGVCCLLQLPWLLYWGEGGGGGILGVHGWPACIGIKYWKSKADGGVEWYYINVWWKQWKLIQHPSTLEINFSLSFISSLIIFIMLPCARERHTWNLSTSVVQIFILIVLLQVILYPSFSTLSEYI